MPAVYIIEFCDWLYLLVVDWFVEFGEDLWWEEGGDILAGKQLINWLWTRRQNNIAI